MGLHVGYIAIKDKPAEEILEILDEFYRGFNLSLVEEKIGNRQSRFTTSAQQYENLQKYEEVRSKKFQESEKDSGETLTTEFDFFEKPLPNSDWCLIEYPQRYAKHALDADVRLVVFLSKRLNIPIITYARDDTMTFVGTSIWENGESKDAFETYDSDIVEGSGYFEQFKGKKVEDYEEIFKIVDPYFEKMGLNLKDEAIPWSNDISRRPMYLKGSPENIIKFLIEEETYKVPVLYL